MAQNEGQITLHKSTPTYLSSRPRPLLSFYAALSDPDFIPGLVNLYLTPSLSLLVVGDKGKDNSTNNDNNNNNNNSTPTTTTSSTQNNNDSSNNNNNNINASLPSLLFQNEQITRTRYGPFLLYLTLPYNPFERQNDDDNDENGDKNNNNKNNTDGSGGDASQMSQRKNSSSRNTNANITPVTTTRTTTTLGTPHLTHSSPTLIPKKSSKSLIVSDNYLHSTPPPIRSSIKPSIKFNQGNFALKSTPDNAFTAALTSSSITITANVETCQSGQIGLDERALLNFPGHQPRSTRSHPSAKLHQWCLCCGKRTSLSHFYNVTRLQTNPGLFHGNFTFATTIFELLLATQFAYYYRSISSEMSTSGDLSYGMGDEDTTLTSTVQLDIINAPSHVSTAIQASVDTVRVQDQWLSTFVDPSSPLFSFQREMVREQQQQQQGQSSSSSSSSPPQPPNFLPIHPTPVVTHGFTQFTNASPARTALTSSSSSSRTPQPINNHQSTTLTSDFAQHVQTITSNPLKQEKSVYFNDSISLLHLDYLCSLIIQARSGPPSTTTLSSSSLTSTHTNTRFSSFSTTTYPFYIVDAIWIPAHTATEYQYKLKHREEQQQAHEKNILAMLATGDINTKETPLPLLSPPHLHKGFHSILLIVLSTGHLVAFDPLSMMIVQIQHINTKLEPFSGPPITTNTTNNNTNNNSNTTTATSESLPTNTPLQNTPTTPPPHSSNTNHNLQLTARSSILYPMQYKNTTPQVATFIYNQPIVHSISKSTSNSLFWSRFGLGAFISVYTSRHVCFYSLDTIIKDLSFRLATGPTPQGTAPWPVQVITLPQPSLTSIASGVLLKDPSNAPPIDSLQHFNHYSVALIPTLLSQMNSAILTNHLLPPAGSLLFGKHNNNNSNYDTTSLYTSSTSTSTASSVLYGNSNNYNSSTTTTTIKSTTNPGTSVDNINFFNPKSSNLAYDTATSASLSLLNKGNTNNGYNKDYSALTLDTFVMNNNTAAPGLEPSLYALQPNLKEFSMDSTTYHPRHYSIVLEQIMEDMVYNSDEKQDAEMVKYWDLSTLPPYLRATGSKSQLDSHIGSNNNNPPQSVSIPTPAHTTSLKSPVSSKSSNIISYITNMWTVEKDNHLVFPSDFLMVQVIYPALISPHTQSLQQMLTKPNPYSKVVLNHQFIALLHIQQDMVNHYNRVQKQTSFRRKVASALMTFATSWWWGSSATTSTDNDDPAIKPEVEIDNVHYETPIVMTTFSNQLMDQYSYSNIYPQHAVLGGQGSIHSLPSSLNNTQSVVTTNQGSSNPATTATTTTTTPTNSNLDLVLSGVGQQLPLKVWSDVLRKGVLIKPMPTNINVLIKYDLLVPIMGLHSTHPVASPHKTNSRADTSAQEHSGSLNDNNNNNNTSFLDLLPDVKAYKTSLIHQLYRNNVNRILSGDTTLVRSLESVSRTASRRTREQTAEKKTNNITQTTPTKGEKKPLKPNETQSTFGPHRIEHNNTAIGSYHPHPQYNNESFHLVEPLLHLFLTSHHLAQHSSMSNIGLHKQIARLEQEMQKMKKNQIDGKEDGDDATETKKKTLVFSLTQQSPLTTNTHLFSRTPTRLSNHHHTLLRFLRHTTLLSSFPLSPLLYSKTVEKMQYHTLDQIYTAVLAQQDRLQNSEKALKVTSSPPPIDPNANYLSYYNAVAGVAAWGGGGKKGSGSQMTTSLSTSSSTPLSSQLDLSGIPSSSPYSALSSQLSTSSPTASLKPHQSSLFALSDSFNRILLYDFDSLTLLASLRGYKSPVFGWSYLIPTSAQHHRSGNGQGSCSDSEQDTIDYPLPPHFEISTPFLVILSRGILEVWSLDDALLIGGGAKPHAVTHPTVTTTSRVVSVAAGHAQSSHGSTIVAEYRTNATMECGIKPGLNRIASIVLANTVSSQDYESSPGSNATNNHRLNKNNSGNSNKNNNNNNSNAPIAPTLFLPGSASSSSSLSSHHLSTGCSTHNMNNTSGMMTITTSAAAQGLTTSSTFLDNNGWSLIDSFDESYPLAPLSLSRNSAMGSVLSGLGFVLNNNNNNNNSTPPPTTNTTTTIATSSEDYNIISFHDRLELTMLRERGDALLEELEGVDDLIATIEDGTYHDHSSNKNESENSPQNGQRDPHDNDDDDDDVEIGPNPGFLHTASDANKPSIVNLSNTMNDDNNANTNTNTNTNTNPDTSHNNPNPNRTPPFMAARPQYMLSNCHLIDTMGNVYYITIDL